MTDCHVVVSGPIASGRTTTAVEIARALPTAVLSKDLIKEALAEPLERTELVGANTTIPASLSNSKTQAGHNSA